MITKEQRQELLNQAKVHFKFKDDAAVKEVGPEARYHAILTNGKEELVDVGMQFFKRGSKYAIIAGCSKDLTRVFYTVWKMDNKITKEQFKEALSATGWTDEKAAIKLHVSIHTIKSWKKGARPVNKLAYEVTKQNKKRS